LGSEIGDFVGVLEHKFTDRHGTAYEEVNLIFEASIEADNMTSVEGHMEFIWSSPGEMTSRNLLPSSLPCLLMKWWEKRTPFHHAQRDD